MEEDPETFGRSVAELHRKFGLKILGGCCGTDDRHIRALASQLSSTNFMDKLFLFTDGSVNTRTKIGYGAYLAVPEINSSPESLREQVKVKRFENTSSTRLELETLLWALKEVGKSANKIIVYTDSQNIMKLESRRERLEKNNYQTKKNRPLNNYELYIEFYKMTDKLDCEFIKVHGHKASNKKDDIDMLFTLVDRESRRALRKEE